MVEAVRDVNIQDQAKKILANNPNIPPFVIQEEKDALSRMYALLGIPSDRIDEVVNARLDTHRKWNLTYEAGFELVEKITDKIIQKRVEKIMANLPIKH